MGCDYYIGTFIQVKMKSGEKYTIEVEKTQGYLSGNEFDRDFETLDDYLEKMNKLFSETKVLLESGEWKCNEDAQERYTYLLNREYPEITISDIQTIQKSSEYYPRY